MSVTVVRYRTKPERGDENQALIDTIAGPDGYRRSEIARQIDQNSRDAATQMVVSHRAAQRRS